jgi:DNA-binding transcriptional MerR regulator
MARRSPLNNLLDNVKKPLDPGTRSRVYNAAVSKENQTTLFLRSSALAKLAGVSTDTLRHYERKGLLAAPRRSANGYREYPQAALERVRLIRRALSVGFTLGELARILRVRDKGGAPCREVRRLAEKKLSEAEMQLAEIVALRDDLREILKDWDSLLSGRTATERVGLLEALAEDGRGSQTLRRPALGNRVGRKNRMKEIDR